MKKTNMCATNVNHAKINIEMNSLNSKEKYFDDKIIRYDKFRHVVDRNVFF